MKPNLKINIRKIADSYLIVFKDAESDNPKQLLKCNETGMIIVDRLFQGVDSEHIVDELVRTFEISEEEAENDLNDFMQVLKEKGVV